MNNCTHHVKCREKGKKTWKFMTPRGGLNSLRIHAAQFTEEKAKAFIEENTPDNPEWEFKSQPIEA